MPEVLGNRYLAKVVFSNICAAMAVAIGPAPAGEVFRSAEKAATHRSLV